MRFSAILTLVLVALSTAVGAHQGATGIVKERMEAMKDIAAQMKSIAGMVRGEADIDIDALAASAARIEKHAGDMPGLFPQGSIMGPSEALPVIWTKWDAFSRSAENLAGRARDLAEAIESDAGEPAMAAAFAAMGETCKSCHTDFRVKKQ